MECTKPIWLVGLDTAIVLYVHIRSVRCVVFILYNS